jgi:hypothetical protein
MTGRPEIPPPIRILLDAGHRAPSADNSQPWRFCWDGDVLTVSYDSKRLRGQTFGPNEHATLVTMGAVRENLVQMADWLGLEPILIPPENDSRLSAYARIKLNHRKVLKTKIEQHHLFKRHTNRLSYARSPIAGDIIETLHTMTQGNCSILTLTDPELIHNIARWVRVAAEVRFQTRELHEFLGRSLRFTAKEVKHGDGLDVRTLNLPLGGTVFLRLMKNWSTLAFLNRFKFYSFLASVEAQLVLKCANVIAIVGPSTRDDDIFDAGSLMERAWIYLNSHGIAVQPYYVVTDQIERSKSRKVPEHLLSHIVKLRSEVAEFFNSAETTIHMLFRIGYPRTVPLRSMRLPLETVTEGNITDAHQ